MASRGTPPSVPNPGGTEGVFHNAVKDPVGTMHNSYLGVSIVSGGILAKMPLINNAKLTFIVYIGHN